MQIIKVGNVFLSVSICKRIQHFQYNLRNRTGVLSVSSEKPLLVKHCMQMSLHKNLNCLFVLFLKYKKSFKYATTNAVQGISFIIIISLLMFCLERWTELID
jgi:hypothetical protein